MASDLGSPPQTANIVAYIYVNRNLHAPVFNQSLYEASILEEHPIDSFVLQVLATDEDRWVRNSTYTQFGDSTPLTGVCC